MNESERKILEELNKDNSLPGEDGLKPEDKEKMSRARILAMVESSPHDFENFDMSQLGKDDFIMEQHYQSGGLSEEKLSGRLQDFDLDHPLNESQKELIAYIMNRMIERRRLQ